MIVLMVMPLLCRQDCLEQGKVVGFPEFAAAVGLPSHTYKPPTKNASKAAPPKKRRMKKV
jgi:hypothetical protein